MLQKIALHSMCRKMLLLGTPNKAATTVPSTGVSNKGVRKAMPVTPKLFQTLTIVLLFLLNKGLFFSIRRRTSQLAALLPRNENTTTLVIMPAMVSNTVSK